MPQAAIVFIIMSSPFISGVKLSIDGKLDLGPKWSYEFKPIRTIITTTTKLERKHLVALPELTAKMLKKYDINKIKKLNHYTNNTEDEPIQNKLKQYTVNINKPPANKLRHLKFNTVEKTRKVTDYQTRKEKETFMKIQDKRKKSTKILKKSIVIASYNDMYVKPHKVKRDQDITEFTIHIYKQSRKIFDSLKEKTSDEDIKNEMDVLAQTYEQKFGDFVRETQRQTIKTRLGTQKVIMNTLDTSNRILSRLVNYLIGQMDTNILRNSLAGNVFQNEVKKKIEIENNHICKKFSICRSQDGFSKFIIDIMEIFISCDDKKLRGISDALTEAMRNTDLSKVMDVQTETNFQKGISKLENFDASLLKALFSIIKNIVLYKNKPIAVIGKIDKRVNKTVGVLEMIDSLDQALPPNEINKLEWEDIKKSLTEWRDGSRKDIQEIMESVVNNIKKGIDSFDDEAAVGRFERNINVLLGTM